MGKNKVLEKAPESPLDCKEIQPVHSEGDQPWDFFGGNDAEAETPVLWPPHAKSWFIGEDSDAGRDWGQEEKGTTEDEMAGWHHWLDEREFEWTLGVGDGQGGLACCDSWGHKELDTTEGLKWTELKVLSESIQTPICQDWWKNYGASTQGQTISKNWYGMISRIYYLVKKQGTEQYICYTTFYTKKKKRCPKMDRKLK